MIFSICYLFFTNELDSKILRYPYFMIAGLVILITLIAVDEIKKSKKVINSESEEDVLTKFKKFDLRGIVFLIASSIIYLILIPIVGYFSTTWVFAILLMYWLGERKIYKVIIISTLFTLIQYIIFQVFLYLPIPRGFLI